ncbi:MAG: hypothetical protein AB7P94_16785 [Steroidobacteraceae bacterium]
MNLNPFKLPTPHEAARRELAQAELQLLAAHTHAEHAAATLTYNQQRVARLRALVAAHEQCEGRATITLPVFDKVTA